MKGYAVFTVLLLLPLSQALFFRSNRRQPAEAEISQDCKDKAAAGDCHFYTCFDQRHPCTTHNWALSYGWRYCVRYDQEKSRFTTGGQEWIDNARACTMQELLKFYEDTHINCEDVEYAMKDAHAKCEKDNGVCNATLVMANKEPLLDIYTLSRRGLVRFLMYIRECGGSELDNFIAWAKTQREITETYFQKVKDLLSEIAEADWGFDEWSLELPELPELPDMPELPEMPELPDMPSFQWPSFGLSWGSSSDTAAAEEEDKSAEVPTIA